jgi:hypothetical protein
MAPYPSVIIWGLVDGHSSATVSPHQHIQHLVQMQYQYKYSYSPPTVRWWSSFEHSITVSVQYQVLLEFYTEIPVLSYQYLLICFFMCSSGGRINTTTSPFLNLYRVHSSYSYLHKYLQYLIIFNLILLQTIRSEIKIILQCWLKYIYIMI